MQTPKFANLIKILICCVCLAGAVHVSKPIIQNVNSSNISDEQVGTYPWDKAIGHFYRMQRPIHKDANVETLWASGAPHKCGKPCVAHCVTGIMPKDPQDLTVVGKWKNTVKQHFETFSESPVAFAVLSLNAPALSNVSQDQMDNFLQIYKPARALLLEEKCKESKCHQQGSHIGDCDFEWFGFNLSNSYGMCDIQIGRVHQCLELISSYEEEHSMTFDWVVRNRPDTEWKPGIESLDSLDWILKSKVHYVVADLSQTKVYVNPWMGRSCFGGCDWWYAMPRRYADIIGDFRDNISCSILKRSPILSFDEFYFPKKDQLPKSVWL